MKKRRIAIASVLKPVDDTRMFEKMGQTLAKIPHTEVYIIGFPAKHPPASTNIHFLPMAHFKRLSIKRWRARWKIQQIIHEVKPELLIVNTHELLIGALINRIFYGTRIFYDIQENYYRNILWTDTFPFLIRYPLAVWVRLKERLLTPFFDQVLLAEKCYLHELTFLHNRRLVLENKCHLPPGFSRKPEKGKTILLFSGTIAESTGVFEAIDLAERLHQEDPSIELHLVGYCALAATWQRIERRLERVSFVHVTGGQQLQPHSTILEAIRTAHFGIIYYPLSPHTTNRIPTKLYEYLACQLPILLQEIPAWVEMAQRVQGAVPVPFDSPAVPQILAQMKDQTFYTHTDPSFTWQSEEAALLTTVGHYIH